MRRVCLLAASLLLSGCLSTPSALPAAEIKSTGQPASAQATPTIAPLPNPAAIPTPLPALLDLRAIKGDLSNQVARLKTNMPRAGSEGFVVPTDAEKAAFASLVAELEAGNARRAAGIAAEHGYELIRYTDRGDDGAQSLLLRETEPIRRGWGLYLFRVGAATDVVVEAPHPLFDEETPTIALAAYRALNARALLIAGAHRDANRNGSADAAHNSQTIFQSVHEALTSGGTPVVLQIHGFAASKHPSYPPVVLGSDRGSTTGTSQHLLERLAEALTTEGIRVGVCDGVNWRDLCGQVNAQSSSGGSPFIHVELDETLRLNDDTLINALVRVFD